MHQNLLEEVETYFTGNTVSQTSVVVGESEEGVRKALGKITPLILSSFMGRAERPGGPEVLWTLTHEAAESGALPNLLTADTLQRRSDLMRALLGEAYGATVARIATATAIQPPSVETLLAIVAQAVLHRLASYATLHHLNPEELLSFLKSQRTQVLEALLPGSSVGPFSAEPASGRLVRPEVPASTVPEPGVGTWAPVGGGHTYSSPAAPATDNPPATSASRWAWVLALVVLGAGAEYFVMRDKAGNGAVATNPAVLALTSAASAPGTTPAGFGSGEAPAAPGGHYDAALDTYVYDPGRPVTLTMVDGSSQTVGVNSTENRLYTFLANPAVQVDPVNRTKGWINFDRVNFDAKKASLTDESRQQLRNVASILKSFPNARAKIGGYTDSTGSVLANLKLSQDRANVALSELVAMGIPLSRLEAKGYGGKHGVASNATPVGRALNRRISIRVTQK
ncbi:OmpA family protein [Hymenobacter chitinivorans]|uniref:Outer membrane protein OmpA-like peptidoglycan-associated protein n=1 Tax=Hymenobacter chitinivorans DSM 11115 TaxID=1121954 RepID=A0A2M9APY1_9BACT|nr:OmpA family protein [Hymenobacter chitinivorans]PJJ47751.1 outer membrane protein OmpA-like peptidoglycan-associated protein [Hymenobacter chitinivorans DSM 11115]